MTDFKELSLSELVDVLNIIHKTLSNNGLYKIGDRHYLYPSHGCFTIIQLSKWLDQWDTYDLNSIVARFGYDYQLTEEYERFRSSLSDAIDSNYNNIRFNTIKNKFKQI